MAVPPPSKDYIRQAKLAERNSYVSKLELSAKAAAAELLCARIFEHLEMKIVAAYVPIGSEIDTAPIVSRLQAQHRIVALPHVTNIKSPMRFLVWDRATPPCDGPFGLKQPAHDAKEVVPDIILTPLLGFDPAMNRIGYGAGFYDRAFVAHPGARRIGLAWAMQECAAIPADEWDVPLHAVATEREWITR